MTFSFARSGISFVLVLILVSLATFAFASNYGYSTTLNPQGIETRQEPPPEPCGFAGTSDIYGIGIRIGYYTQAVSVWFANFFVLREAKSLRAINTLFMFAMFVGLIFISATPSQTYGVEAYIMIQIIFVVWYVGTLDASRYSWKYWRFDFERMVIKEGCFIGMIIYNAWYWWAGLDVMQKTPCGTFGYFFSKVALDGWYRKANMVLAILAICGHMLLVCGNLFRTLRHFYCRKINSAEYQGELQRRLESAEDTTDFSRDYRADLDPCSHSQRPSIPKSPRSILSINPSPPTPFDHELDNLPKSSPTKLPVITTSEVHDHSDATWPDFRDLYAADTYITSVLSACPDSILSSTRFQTTILHGFIKLYIPYLHPTHGTDAVPLRTCLATLLRATHNHHTLNAPALAILLAHIYALQSQPFYRYPWLLHRAVTDPAHPAQHWRPLATIANIRIARLPATTRKWYWIPSAVQAGVVTVGLVLSVELTVAWNGVSGVNQIGTVGQLVPFVLGVGGLVKVLWSWLQGRLGTGGEEALGVGGEEAESSGSRLAAAYYGRKEAFERRLGVGTFERGGDGDGEAV